jgi:hypothetical protein
LVRSTVDALAMARSDLVHEAVATILERCGDSVLDELAVTAAAEHSPSIRRALFRRAALPSRPAPLRARDYRAVLPRLLAHHEVQQGADALEFLEEAARDGIDRDQLIEVLRDPSSYSPAWDRARAAESRARLLEAAGRHAEAAIELETLCFQLLAGDDAYALDDVTLLLEHLVGYGPAAAGSLDRLEPIVDARWQRREEADRAEHGDAEPMADREHPLRVLIVGGNERQAKMDDDIRKTLAERCPDVTVEFLHPGWSTNWSAHVADFQRRVANADAVVLLTLMRTTLGWTIRAQCNVPWRGCRGRGQGAVITAVERVLPMARAHLAARARAVGAT